MAILVADLSKKDRFGDGGMLAYPFLRIISVRIENLLVNF